MKFQKLLFIIFFNNIIFANEQYYKLCMKAENAITNNNISKANKIYKRAFKIEVPIARDYSNFLRINSLHGNISDIEYSIEKFGNHFHSSFYLKHLNDTLYNYYLSKNVILDSNYKINLEKLTGIFEDDQKIRKEGNEYTQNKYKDSIYATKIRIVDSLNLLEIFNEVILKSNTSYFRILSSESPFFILLSHMIMYDKEIDTFFIDKMMQLVEFSKYNLNDRKYFVTILEKSEEFCTSFNTGYTYFILNDSICLSFNQNKLPKETLFENRKKYCLESLEIFRKKMKWQYGEMNRANLNFLIVNIAFPDKETERKMITSDLNDVFYLK